MSYDYSFKAVYNLKDSNHDDKFNNKTMRPIILIFFIFYLSNSFGQSKFQAELAFGYVFQGERMLDGQNLGKANVEEDAFKYYIKCN